MQSGEHLYIGYTHDLRRRFKEHNDGTNTATKAYTPWELIFYEAHTKQDDALR
jgi:predicted GIY-YIG superfamily endonuclease